MTRHRAMMSAHCPQALQRASAHIFDIASAAGRPVSRSKSAIRSVRQATRSDAVSFTTVDLFSSCSILGRDVPCVGVIKLSDSVRVGRRLVNEGKCQGDSAVESRARLAAIRCCNWTGDTGRVAPSCSDCRTPSVTVSTAGLGGQTLYTSIKTDIQHPQTGCNVGFCDPRCQASFAARSCCTIARAGISAAATAARILGSGDGLAVAASISSSRSMTNNRRRQRSSERNHADKSQVIRTPSADGSVGAAMDVCVMAVEYSTSRKHRYAAKVANENGHSVGCPIFAPAAKTAPDMGRRHRHVAPCRAFEAREGASHTPNWPGRFPRAARSLWLCRPSNVRHPVHGRQYGAGSARTRIATLTTVQPARRDIEGDPPCPKTRLAVAGDPSPKISPRPAIVIAAFSACSSPRNAWASARRRKRSRKTPSVSSTSSRAIRSPTETGPPGALGIVDYHLPAALEQRQVLGDAALKVCFLPVRRPLAQGSPELQGRVVPARPLNYVGQVSQAIALDLGPGRVWPSAVINHPRSLHVAAFDLATKNEVLS